jgi:hypothetical protein
LLSGPEVVYGIVVGNNPVKWFDPLGLAPNKPFPSPNAAAIDAIDYYMKIATKSNREYGGWIYKMNNKFYYSEAVAGTNNELLPCEFKEPPQGSEKVRMWHIHPGDAYNVFWWSTEDTLTSGLYHKVLYLGVKDGRIKLWDPAAPSWLDERTVR